MEYGKHANRHMGRSRYKRRSHQLPEDNIRLSIDGGKTFPYLLGDSVPNSGSASINIPANIPATTKARISVEAVGNIFFDYSDFDFNIAN